MSERAPASPCTSVCQLDPATGWCRGCLRTIEEIAGWPRFSPKEKHRIVATIAVRRAGPQGSHAGAPPNQG